MNKTIKDTLLTTGTTVVVVFLIRLIEQLTGKTIEDAAKAVSERVKSNESI